MTDELVIYTAKDVQEIFHLNSIQTARRLMNNPSFPLMRVGRKMLVTKENLEKFIKQNGSKNLVLY